MGKINKKMSFRVPTEKPKKQDLELAMRLPMEYIPDPRTIIEDAQDKEKEDRDAEDRRKVIDLLLIHSVESLRRANGERSSKACPSRGKEEEA